MSRLATAVSPIRRCATVSPRRSRSWSLGEKLARFRSSSASALAASAPPRRAHWLVRATRNSTRSPESPLGLLEDREGSSRRVSPIGQLGEGNPELDPVRPLISGLNKKIVGAIPLLLRRESLGT